MKRLLLALVCLAAACVPSVVVRDHDATCRVAAQMLNEPLSSADLVELSAPFPEILSDAVRAYQARIAGIVQSSLGGAGLVGAFVTGFATNTTETPVRIGLGVDVGVTIALGVGAIVAARIHSTSTVRAIHGLQRVTRNVCP